MSQIHFQHKILPLKNKLFRFAFYYMKDRDEAEDMVQECMLKAWDKRSQWDEIRNMEAWCMQVTKNLCLDKIRSRKAFHDDVSKAYQLKQDEPDPEQSLLWKDQVEELRKIVQSLPESQKDVLILREFEEMSYQEIADHLQLELSTVKVNIHRARKTLQQKINKLNNYGVLKN